MWCTNSNNNALLKGLEEIASSFSKMNKKVEYCKLMASNFEDLETKINDMEERYKEVTLL